MALDYTGNDLDKSQPADDAYYAPPDPRNLQMTVPANARFQPIDKSVPAYRATKWVDTQTGQTYDGMLDSSGYNPTHLVIGFTRGNPSNTTSFDIFTGQKHEAMPHPNLD